MVKPTGDGRNAGEERTVNELTLVGLERTQKAVCLKEKSSDLL